MTTKRCSACGESLPSDSFYLRDGSLSSRCKPCTRSIAKKWQEDNPERAAKRKQEWEKKQPPRVRDKEKQKEYQATYVSRNPEKRRASARDWAKRNPESRRSNERRRRARLRSSETGVYTERQVLELYGTDCHICGTPVDIQAPRKPGALGWEKSLHIDHLVPICDEGPDILFNVRPSHGLCNLKKNGKR